MACKCRVSVAEITRAAILAKFERAYNRFEKRNVGICILAAYLLDSKCSEAVDLKLVLIASRLFLAMRRYEALIHNVMAATLCRSTRARRN